MTALSSGTVNYKKVSRMSGPGLENPLNTTDASPFTISIGGSDGDVPFELRRHFCSMPTTTINGSPDVFETSTESEAVFRINHRYTTNPLVMSTTTSASINCINWQKERSSCADLNGPMSYSFDVTLVNNGTTYQGIPGPIKVNMRHATGSGIGLTW